MVTDAEFQRMKGTAVERALNILSTPTPDVPYSYDVEVARSSQEVLDCEQLTITDVLNDPTTLLRGDAYGGGSTAKMDPFHPASAALSELRFAAHDAVAFRRPDVIATAMERAEEPIRAYGVPREVARVSTTGTSVSVYHFEPTDIFTLMPGYTPHGWTFAPRPPMDRATATYLLLGALAGMPADHQARLDIETYVGMVANPGVPSILLKPYATNVTAAILGEPDDGTPHHLR